MSYLPQGTNSSIVVITDGTIDGVVIGGVTPAAGSFTSINLADGLLSRPRIQDYGEVVNVLGDLGGGADTIDIENGNVVSATISTAPETFTFSNPSAAGNACSFTLILTNGGSQVVNWPVSVDWAAGNAPTLTAAGVDVLVFVTIDGGTTWLGFVAGLDMK